MKICVIIPVFNDWDVLQANFDQFRMASNVGDIFIVDNGSESIPNIDLPKNITLLHCEKPGSYSARNKALNEVLYKYDIFAFTDADCCPCENWLSLILEYYENNQYQGLLAGGVTMVCKAERPNYCESYDMALGLPQERYVKNGYAVTANLAFHRTVFEDVGLFDDTRFSGGDAEICRRANSAGLPLRYLSEAMVLHPARSSFTQLVTKVRRVSGGQVGNGEYLRRLKYLLVNLTPPVRGYYFILQKRKILSGEAILKAMVVLTILWPVRAVESIMALLRGPRVR